MTTKWDLFDIGLYLIEPKTRHAVGSIECERCYAEETEPCDCGGRIHTESYVDENGDVRFSKMGDKCEEEGEA